MERLVISISASGLSLLTNVNTGNQGSSVARSLLSNKDKAFQVRGITRNPDSDKAKELSSLGVEVVKGDGWNKEEMVKAFSGSWGVFLNTNSDDPVGGF